LKYKHCKNSVKKYKAVYRLLVGNGAGGRRQEAGGRRQEAGGRRQEAEVL
jgi:hypothetical protein